MFKKSATAAGVALAGVMLLLSAPALASADELPPEPVVEEVAAPVDEVPVDQAPADVAEEPTPVVDEAPAAPVEPPVEAAPEPPAVVTPPPATKTLTWAFPDGGTPETAVWPQTVFNPASVPCGTSLWLQVDVYAYTTPEEQAAVDALDDDGVLTRGEDYGLVISWTFEQYTAPACEPEPPVTPEEPVTPVPPVAPVPPTEPIVETVAQDLAPAPRVAPAELAETGGDQGPLMMLGGAAAAAALAGAVLLALPRRRTRG